MKSRLDKVLFRILGKDVTFPPENYKLPAFIKVISKIFSYVFTIALLLLGAVGLVSAYLNPFTYLLPYVDNCYSYLGLTACGAENSLIQLESLSTTLYHNMLYTLVGSIAMLTIGLLQPEARRTYFSLPRKTMQAYRAIVTARDYLIAKIEYLNSESGKWKRVFQVMRSPYSLLRAMGLSPNMAVSFLAVGGVASTTVAVDQVVFSEASFARGDSGIYAAALFNDDKSLDIPTELIEGDNTLQINLGARPVSEISISNVTVNAYAGSSLPSGKAETILVSGNPTTTDPAFTATRLEIGTFIFEKNRCESLEFQDISAHEIIIEDNLSDGQSIVQTIGTGRNLAVIGGHHQADFLSTEGGGYDRIWIDAPVSNTNGRIGKLTLSNIYTKGGSCVLKNMDIGVLRISQNEIGGDSDLATKAFKVLGTVKASNWSVNRNTEKAMGNPPNADGS